MVIGQIPTQENGGGRVEIPADPGDTGRAIENYENEGGRSNPKPSDSAWRPSPLPGAIPETGIPRWSLQPFNLFGSLPFFMSGSVPLDSTGTPIDGDLEPGWVAELTGGGATGRLPRPTPLEPPTIGVPQLPPPEVTDQGFGGIPIPPTSELARAAGILTASGVGIYCLAKIIPLAIAFFFPPSAPVMIPAALLV